MATIRYNIEYAPDGSATVVQDVILIDNHDQVVFWTTGNNVPPGQTIAVTFEKSPFKANSGGPQTGVPFAVQALDTTRYNVNSSNRPNGVLHNGKFGIRRTFAFDCGFAALDTKTMKAVADTFRSFSSWSSNGVAAANHIAAAAAHTAAAVALTQAGTGNPPDGSAPIWTAAAAGHTAAAAAHTAAAAATTSAGAAGDLPEGGDDGN